MWLLFLTFLFFGYPALTSTIKDIEHVVIFMQENRAFDHYYGTLRGVRGYNDRTVISLPNGAPVWNQPVNSSYHEAPWHLDTLVTSGDCAPAPAMDYPVDIAMWNKGYYDQWNRARFPGTGMSYFKRRDLEYYYSLADQFTICDQYFASTLTQTNPNRLHLFSGSNGLSVGKNAVLDNTEPKPGWTWITMGEILEKEGISWRVYQESDNFDDNGFAWFASFQEAKPGSPLYEKGIRPVPDIVAAFKEDMETGKLPQVSWIIAPEALSEHARNIPALGEDLSARLLIALSANPEIYKKTVFFLNYDEQGGFFDHVPPPTPPTGNGNGGGKSTVTTKGEVWNGLPIGFGFRVPMIVISPWTRGGWVNSEVFEHTSVIQFVEKRFGIKCPNISPWRRAVAGDLLSTFDFANPDYSWPTLPNTDNYVKEALRECKTLPFPEVPAKFEFPVQETGTRPARPLPYALYATTSLNITSNPPTLVLRLSNVGTATMSLALYDDSAMPSPPRHYTVEPGKYLSDSLPSTPSYAFSLYGPNGFFRRYSGSVASLLGNIRRNPSAIALENLIDVVDVAIPDVSVTYHTHKATPSRNFASLSIVFNNTGTMGCTFRVVADPKYRKDGPWEYEVAAKSAKEATWEIGGPSELNWYDFVVTVPALDSSWERRVMGHVETGYPSFSDPAMA